MHEGRQRDEVESEQMHENPLDDQMCNKGQWTELKQVIVERASQHPSELEPA